ncbi:hypothetical protein [Endozoicomonas euniceicola]|uniref:Uncharacterized protein n=1 Tax=Endozoicomonas euniceicola TaxID=1234143 RepID=A0ABY6GWQ4_9GAMM|nr:hypothetical protein [Endozoicomonas euniceicola]UYM16414.1 hypothetical protein NX720_00320 [Endozoicomonas euniceicola]
MAKSFDTLRNGMTPKARDAAEAEAESMIKQADVSKMEHRTDAHDPVEEASSQFRLSMSADELMKLLRGNDFRRRGNGAIKGKIEMAEDFDQTSEEVIESFYGTDPNDLTKKGKQ